MTRLIIVAALGLATLLQAGNLIAGGPDEVRQTFDRDGALLSQTLYRDGRKVGRFVSYWPNHRRRVEALYAGDVIEGAYRSWHANGLAAEVRHYVAGHEAGPQQAWTDRGELYLNFEVRNGRHYGLVNARPCLPTEGVM